MVAKFLDDNKPTVSNINFDYLNQFHLICLMMAKFSGVKSERTVSKFRNRKRKFLRCACLLRKATLKLVREIRKFHVAVVQRWVQKSVMLGTVVVLLI